jgi:hypothetical protein
MYSHYSDNEHPAPPLSEPTNISMGCILLRSGDLLNSAPGLITDEQIEAIKRDQPDTTRTPVSPKATDCPPDSPAASLPQPILPVDANRHRCFKQGCATPRAPDPTLPGEVPEPASPTAQNFGAGACKKRFPQLSTTTCNGTTCTCTCNCTTTETNQSICTRTTTSTSSTT